MKKLVVFNVGGALCCYLEVADHSFLIDVGEGNGFSPVNDFLLPCYKASCKQKENNKYKIDQLIISHPHHDHISGIIDFDKYFNPEYITCPNDKSDNNLNNIDWELFSDNESDECVDKLKEMYDSRTLPLQKVLNGQSSDSQYIYYIKPGEVALDEALKNESYANNISLTCLFKINGFSVFFPGDIMKEGFKKLLDCKELTSTFFDLRSGLRRFGVDILIAPHHGLKSAFSTEFFDTLPNHKVRSIIIASEKQNNPDENREVDGRYSDGDYCEGRNGLISENGASENYFRKTSQGHICINFEAAEYPDIKIIKNNDELVEWFLS